MKYYPDYWAIVKIDTPDGPLYKAFATWDAVGEFEPSWRLNSGIVSVEFDEVNNEYHVFGYSGSEYCLTIGDQLDPKFDALIMDWLYNYPKITVLSKEEAINLLNNFKDQPHV